MTDSKIGAKNTVDNICPFCGASDDMGLFTDEVSYWDCGSPQEEDWRSDDCCNRQIAALQENVECLKDLHLEISALKERLEAWRALAPELDWKVYEDGAISYMISGKHLKRLKDLNEL